MIKDCRRLKGEKKFTSNKLHLTFSIFYTKSLCIRRYIHIIILEKQIEGLCLKFESGWFEAGLVTWYAVWEKTQKDYIYTEIRVYVFLKAYIYCKRRRGEGHYIHGVI